MTADPPVYLGIDLGTSALKVVALDADGRTRASARHSYPTDSPEPGAAEQDPTHWWAALRQALDQLAADVPPASWTAVGLSGMLPTLVELDARGQPVGPAITWQDARAEPEADALRDAVGDDALYRITGQRVDGRYLAPMHNRLRALGRAGSTAVGAKDALHAHLTGRLITDPSTAAGSGVFDLETGCWNTDLIRAAGMGAMPAIAPPDTATPIAPAWLARWGRADDLPVVLGAADSVLGALGLGAITHGDAAVIAGTSAIVLGVSDTPARDVHRRFLVTPLAGPGWGLEMDLLAMGSAIDGIATLLGLTGPAELLELAATVQAPDAPVFLPYLNPGEQGALWDPMLTGTLHGLTLGMGPAHVGRALLTGIVTELRRCVEILAASTGRRGPLLLGGGASTSPLMWQDLADATGREVVVDVGTTDHSAIGAALLAASSQGCHITRVADTRRVAPRPQWAGFWADAAERHDTLRRNVSRGESG